MKKQTLKERIYRGKLLFLIPLYVIVWHFMGWGHEVTMSSSVRDALCMLSAIFVLRVIFFLQGDIEYVYSKEFKEVFKDDKCEKSQG